MKNGLGLQLSWVIAMTIAMTAAVVAHAQVDTPTQVRTSLSSRDRSHIEALACRPLGVAAIEIVGTRALEANERKATRAIVKCAPHIRAEGVEAGHRGYCKLEGKAWSCKEDAVYLRRAVAGKGPFEIAAQFLTFEEAQTVIGCLEAALRDQPGLLDSGPLTKVEYLLRALPSEEALIGLKSGPRCFTARLPLRCATESGRPGPVAISSCDL
jgi:hypothetical protein